MLSQAIRSGVKCAARKEILDVHVWSRASQSFAGGPCPLRGGRPEDLMSAKPFDEIPGPKPYPLIGTAYIYKPIGKYKLPEDARNVQTEKFRKYGKIYKEKIGGQNFVHIHEPEDMMTMHKHEGKYPVRGIVDLLKVYHERTGKPKILVATGEEHLYYRTKLQQQLLRPDMVSYYLDIQGGVADDFITRIRAILDDNKEVMNLSDELFNYACEAVGAVSFDKRLNCMCDNPEAEIKDFIRALNDSFHYISKSMVSFPWYKYFRSPMYRAFEKDYNSVNELSKKYTDEAFERLEESKSRRELPENNTFIMQLLTQENLTKDEVMAATTALFVGGVESTAKTLGCQLYLLATNPEWQEAVREEVNGLLPGKAPLTGKIMSSMPQLKSFVKECYRVAFPTVFGNARILDHDVVMSGYRVPAGTQIVSNSNAALRLPDFFQDPNKFNPQRWQREHRKENILPPNEAAVINLPFGKGIRSCIGKRFAEQEIYLALTKILQHFRVEYHHAPIEFMSNGMFTDLEYSPKLRFVDI